VTFPWQNVVVAQLERQIADGRLPHGVLLCARPGWGSAELGAWLAGRLVGVGNDKPIAEVAHPDLRCIEPEGAWIKVDQIRALNEFAIGRPQIAAVKVGLITLADRMNPSAQNALLKSLEEPPPGTHIVLATTHPARLLATVRSRCQRFEVSCDREAAGRWYAHEGGDQSLLDDCLGAPLAALEAARAGELPIVELLDELANGRGVASLLAQDPVRLAARWYARLCGHLSGANTLAALAMVERRAVFAFADELIWFSRNIEAATGGTGRLLTERLAALWLGLTAASDPSARGGRVKDGRGRDGRARDGRARDGRTR
jgi:DNA polymerase-3 subunit delta'